MTRFILAALLFAAFSAQAAPRAYDITVPLTFGAGPTSSAPDTGKVSGYLKNSANATIFGPNLYDTVNGVVPSITLKSVMLDAGAYSVCAGKLTASGAVSAQPSGDLCAAFSISNDFTIQIVKSIGAPAIVVSPVQP